MKTRSNMPLYVLEVDNVKTLTNSQIDLLRCGDYLVKKDASGEHAYKVTFKSDTGMCITYHDASVIETQSYDKINNVWTYNSEDKTPNLLELQNVEDAPDGTINKALGLDSNGDLVKGTISGGTKLYKHSIKITCTHTVDTVAMKEIDIVVINNESSPCSTSNMSSFIGKSLFYGVSSFIKSEFPNTRYDFDLLKWSSMGGSGFGVFCFLLSTINTKTAGTYYETSYVSASDVNDTVTEL